jgi:aromatic-L-amino-acid decarboxylase
MSGAGSGGNAPTLDPKDWTELRAQGHRMLDDMLDYLEHLRDRPVWQPMTGEARAHFRDALPAAPTDLAAVYQEFSERILPYSSGNAHPGFMGWVQGGGTAVGMLAEMLAATLNANCGGRDHAPIEVERQIARWAQQMFGFPESASGIFVTGTSIANFLALIVARTNLLGTESRRDGIAASGRKLTAYVSAAAHICVRQAMELAGFGSDALRLIPTDRGHRIDVAALGEAIAQDRAAGFTPFFLVGNAGTVDIGAIDDLDGLASLAKRERLWFHVDGALGALAVLAPALKPRFKGMERADSIAFDFHKWGQVPYDAGFILVRDGELHRAAFASPAAYLRRETRGLAGGSPWPCDFGPDLSRGFRALKTWFTLKVYGSERLGAEIARSCALAQYLKNRIEAEPRLELMAPVALNIVCFRYRAADADRRNAVIVAELQESGVAAPSTTLIDGKLAIRACLINHRTRECDIDALLQAVLRLGAEAERPL